MSTVLNTNGETLALPRLECPGTRFHIVTAEWNPAVTHALRDGARDVLLGSGAEETDITLHKVPGTVELINAAAMIVNREPESAVIVIGCVIRGDTPHFDYVCQQAAQGVAILNARGEAPVIFGVLTVDDLSQALDRAGGRLGNKGAEAACAAVEMVNLHFRYMKD